MTYVFLHKHLSNGFKITSDKFQKPSAHWTLRITVVYLSSEATDD